MPSETYRFSYTKNVRKSILDREWSVPLIRILCNKAMVWFCSLWMSVCSLILWFVVCVSWGIPFAITVAALSLHKIGYDASAVSVGWCWVNIQAEDHVLWMLLTGKIWEFIAYVTLPVLYILIKIHIHNAVSPPWLIADGLTLQLSRGLHDIFINS